MGDAARHHTLLPLPKFTQTNCSQSKLIAHNSHDIMKLVEMDYG